MAGRVNFVDRVKARQDSAAERQAEREKRTHQQQLDLLIKRGHGHCKEAAKLRSKIGRAE